MKNWENNVFFPFGDSLASEFDMPTFWSTLTIPSSLAAEDVTGRVY
jgi:hypothetical protein